MPWVASWTPEEIDRLRALAGGDDMPSAAEMTAHFPGRSRNAIIGACHRYGIKLQHPPHYSYDPNKPRKPRKPRAKKLHIERKPRKPMPIICDVVEPLNVPLPDAPGVCRYPYGDGPVVFCGHPAWEDSPYCPAHHRLCRYTPEEVRRAKEAA